MGNKQPKEQLSDKQLSTFSKITKVVVWIMIFAILGSAILTAVLSFVR